LLPYIDINNDPNRAAVDDIRLGPTADLCIIVGPTKYSSTYIHHMYQLPAVPGTIVPDYTECNVLCTLSIIHARYLVPLSEKYISLYSMKFKEEFKLTCTSKTPRKQQGIESKNTHYLVSLHRALHANNDCIKLGLAQPPRALHMGIDRLTFSMNLHEALPSHIFWDW